MVKSRKLILYVDLLGGMQEYIDKQVEDEAIRDPLWYKIEEVKQLIKNLYRK